MDINWNTDAQAHIDALVDHMLDTKLGPMMRDEVIKNCPVDTGALAASTDYHVEDHKLYVTAIGDESREAENRRYYASWVDLGHRIFIFGHDSGKVQPPTFYMRRALYRHYPGF